MCAIFRTLPHRSYTITLWGKKKLPHCGDAEICLIESTEDQFSETLRIVECHVFQIGRPERKLRRNFGREVIGASHIEKPPVALLGDRCLDRAVRQSQETVPVISLPVAPDVPFTVPVPVKCVEFGIQRIGDEPPCRIVC